MLEADAKNPMNRYANRLLSREKINTEDRIYKISLRCIYIARKEEEDLEKLIVISEKKRNETIKQRQVTALHVAKSSNEWKQLIGQKTFPQLSEMRHKVTDDAERYCRVHIIILTVDKTTLSSKTHP